MTSRPTRVRQVPERERTSPFDAERPRSVAPKGLVGAVAPTRYGGGTDGGPPTTGDWLKGDWIVDRANAAIWVCVVSGRPGAWRQAGGASKDNEAAASVLTNYTVPGDAGNRAFHFESDPVAAGFTAEGAGMTIDTAYSSSFLSSLTGGLTDATLVEPFTPGGSLFRATARLHLPQSYADFNDYFIGIIIKDSAAGLGGVGVVAGISYTASTRKYRAEYHKIVGGVQTTPTAAEIVPVEWMYVSINATNGGLPGNPTCEFSGDRAGWPMVLSTSLVGALTAPAKLGIVAGAGSVDFIDLTPL